MADSPPTTEGGDVLGDPMDWYANVPGVQDDIATLRRRAHLGRLVSFKTHFYDLPTPVQHALEGIAGELEAIADRMELRA